MPAEPARGHTSSWLGFLSRDGTTNNNIRYCVERESLYPLLRTMESLYVLLRAMKIPIYTLLRTMGIPKSVTA